MGKFRSRLYKTDRARDFDHEQDRSIRIQQIYQTIDRQPYQWIVVLVAGVGFFLDGYSLFASNMALPMMSYVYWRDNAASRRLTLINIATLAGTFFGQILFGFLADKNGRKKMYGIELLLVIGSTLGAAMASTGYENSMSIFAWLIWWRIMVGIGVGADYPLSAVITSEFAPTKHRARMMATVFFMQPLGQISGNLVSLIVIAVSRQHGNDDLARSVDIMWRWVVGIGVIPGAIALLFRFAIPETPRFLLEIEGDPVKAEFDATALFNESPTSHELDFANWNNISLPTTTQRSLGSIDEDSATAHTDISIQQTTLNSHWRLAKADIIQYFWTEGNWRALAGTSLTWLLLDFGFYGIGLSSPQFLANIWGSLHISGAAPPWQTDDRPDANLYDMFMNTSIHAMVILNIGSVIGGLLLILFAHRINRISLQKYGFVALAALFIALGVIFINLKREGPFAVVLYIIGQLLFNFGPNATTYMIPAEIFPTRYRATCHGISAASGKLGSILVQIFSAYYKFGSSPGSGQTVRYGWILVVFSVCMILGALITHFWIPSIQRKADRGRLWGGKPETLEILAQGRRGTRK
ncbi:inorganic phosphate transporter [Xylona heveae TC161]|uniref:Inorganic phosphate transporter n=1 Tax=Xylona heveae (strain CBS 132557 / TC161) TaxID=1328760 RepID=A0A165FF84_XYLHT|nr:inorganic phosphate transporter [Xylona heveae TC161]KZF20905.1 inorganic phosphate transporter [Xylona heveae TC161]